MEVRGGGGRSGMRYEKMLVCKFFKLKTRSGKVAHIFSPSICEAETGGILLVQSQPDLHSGFQASQHYTVRSCLKNK